VGTLAKSLEDALNTKGSAVPVDDNTVRITLANGIELTATYNVAASKLNANEAVESCDECNEENKVDGKIYLFYTKTCPNCKMAKLLLTQHNVNYEAVDAEENPDLTRKFGVRKAPTLFVPNGDKYDVYDNASLIKGYLEGRKDA